MWPAQVIKVQQDRLSILKLVLDDPIRLLDRFDPEGGVHLDRLRVRAAGCALQKRDVCRAAAGRGRVKIDGRDLQGRGRNDVLSDDPLGQYDVRVCRASPE